ncbi:MAG: glycosyltransferase [Gemmatimonadota bacterium]
MRLLLLTSVMPTPYRATKGAFNAALVAGLREAGDDVRVVAPVPWTDRWRLARGPVPDASAHYPTWYYPPRLGHASHHRWMRRQVLPAVETLTSAWQPEVVLGYWAHPDGAVAIEAARWLGVPAVLLVGGSDIQLLTADPSRRAVILETLLAADRVLAVGAPLRQRVIALGVPAERVGVFERGVDRVQFGPGDSAVARTALALPHDRHVVLWVGRMVPVKGLDVLFDAWPVVTQQLSNPLLVLVGEGENRPALEARARALGAEVRFVGPVAHAELPNWYRAADLIVLPSRSEGIPNVLLEGLACGTPFVASDVGGVAELLQPGCLLVTPERPDALAAAVVAALQQPPMHRVPVQKVLDRREAVAALRATIAGIVAQQDDQDAPVEQ